MMNNAVIIGHGVVGKATKYAFGIEKFYDIRGSNVTLKEAADLRYVFICLPTPVKNGRYFVDDIFSIIKQIRDYGKQNVFIIRSTVFPGFANSLMDQLKIRWVISNPEFLSEDTWKDDVEHPDLVVVGGAQKNYIEDVEGIYKARYKGVDIYKTDNTTAELAKLTINGFYATKIVFANQIYDYANRLKANYEKVREIMHKRKWIGDNHLKIFHKGGRGASGKCLSKDLEALSTYSSIPLLNVVDKINNSYLMDTGKK